MEAVGQMERGPAKLKSRPEWVRVLTPTLALNRKAISFEDLKQTGEVVSPEAGMGRLSVERPGNVAEGGSIDEKLVPGHQDPVRRSQPPLVDGRRMPDDHGAVAEPAGKAGQHR